MKRLVGNCQGGPGRPVEKIDRDGNVLDVYRSVSAAANANFVSFSAVWRRCMNKVREPSELLGFTFRYSEPPRDYSVEKIDRDGNVLDTYPNTIAAAKANYVSDCFVWCRLHHKLKKDPFKATGFSFRFSRKSCNNEI